jgi:glutamyl-tRNA reductase
MNLVVVGLSCHTAPVEIRERFAFAEAEVAPALARMRTGGIASEAVLLSTCNRVEIYAAGLVPAQEGVSAVRTFLAKDRSAIQVGPPEFYGHCGAAGLEHLFRVACGLDSLVLGETEILGQLKKAYDIALAAGHTGRVLNKAFQGAFSVAKKIRAETEIQKGNTSVASVSVDLAERIFDGISGRDVMVIGAGDTSEKTARALMSRGARSLIVSNRSFDRAAALAAELGGRAITFDAWESEFAAVDIVISSTSAPHFILDQPKLEKLVRRRGARPLLLIDLAVPRDIDPEVKRIDNVFLANVDDLQAVADEHVRHRRNEITRCEAILRERAVKLLESLGAHPHGAFRTMTGGAA